MRVLLFALFLAVAVAALETEHFVITPDDPTLAGHLENAYSFYVSKGLSPAPPCQGSKYQVYYSQSLGDVAYTKLGRGCVIEIDFGRYTRRLVFHEVGHVFLANYDPDMYDYFWAKEAAPEGMASVATGVYYFPAMYFSDKLYSVNPFSLEEERVYDWYKYSAAVAWHLQQASSWESVLKAFLTRNGAARLYVQFLLALAKGVELGGVRYEPERKAVTLSPGPYYLYLDIPGYSAVYYEFTAPTGLVKISVDDSRVVSNLLVNREFEVRNGTLLAAFVNNSSDTVHVAVTVFFTQLRAYLAGGWYEDGKISVNLCAELNGVKINGVVRVNGSEVRLADGCGVYNFTGVLRPYTLAVEYGGYAAYVSLNLSPPALSVSPSRLFLGAGGRGYLNVSLSNPNPLTFVCFLNAAASGVQFNSSKVAVPPNSTAVLKLGFKVVDKVGGNATVSCGVANATAPIYGLSYSLSYDLDSERGVLTAYFGSEQRSYSVGKLPADVELVYGGYVAAVVHVEARLSVSVSSPKLEGGLLRYVLSVAVVGPPWAKFSGAASVDGVTRGVYTGGVLNLTVALRPGEKRRVLVGVGRLAEWVSLEAPEVVVKVEPLGAVVEGGVARILVGLRYNVEVSSPPPPNFDGALSVEPLQGGLAVVSYRYGENVTVVYEGRAAAAVYLPRPNVSLLLVEDTVRPNNFSAVFKAVVSVCKPSVDARYVVEVGGRRLVVNVPRGGCGFNFTELTWHSAYGPVLNVSVPTSFGPATAHLYVPPPRVEARLLNWTIDKGGESAFVELRVETPGNYTYVVAGRGVRGSASFVVGVRPSGGVATVDYGFGALSFTRPLAVVAAQPILAEVGSSAHMQIRVEVPQGLYIRGVLATPWLSREVSLGPGVYAESVPVDTSGRPGAYEVEVKLGPYVNRTTVVLYKVELSLSAPRLLPVGATAEVQVVGRVEPAAPARVAVRVEGCGLSRADVVPLNATLRLSSNATCAARIAAASNSTSAEATVEWASLTAGLNYTRLGSLRGLPIFPVGGLLAVPLLGGRQVDGRVEVVGDFRRLGLVNYTIRVTYMGVSNVTEFVGFAVPPDAYTAANRTYGLLPPEARPYYRYLLERAVATGDWRLVEDLAKLYSEPPTPLTLAARALVEMSLASGREPNMGVVETLRKVEPLLLGVAGGFLLALLRRL
mgnify:CR=1 FL=1